MHTSIRIYDVEPQVHEDIEYVQHYLRIGMLDDISDHFNTRAPFANQIKTIAQETGADIEYRVFDNWEDLFRAEEEFEDAKVTEMILFNNTYEGSILKEMGSGRYLDLKDAMAELGFYEEDAYEQTVLEAGMMDGQQVFVPLLYNVAGMIQADPEMREYDEWKSVAYTHAENAKPDFEEFLDMLMEAMRKVNVEEVEVPFLSSSFLNGEMDSYITAAGIEWDSYGQQRELFGILYEYMQTYLQTQVDTQENGISNQMLYGKYVEEYQRESPFGESMGELIGLSEQAIDDLNIDYYPTEGTVEEPAFSLVVSMLDRTEYFVDCSTAEDVAFHSVLGLLGYRDYYVKAVHNNMPGEEFVVDMVRGMNYWPIGAHGIGNEYAAQPICYAAVVGGGSASLSAKVLQSMMNQPVGAKYGIPVCKETQQQQMTAWMSESDRMGYIRAEDRYEKFEQSYWGPLMGSYIHVFLEDKEVYGSQIQYQIDHIGAAEIPDREILAIWQDTLTESVEQGLSSQAGFELLCERMDAWYE